MTRMEGFLVCPSCGQTFAAFQKSGLLGCSKCYAAFEQELGRVFKRLHGATKHPVSFAPVQMPIETLDDLEAQLADAVQREDYEEAGRLRDRIETLKAQTGYDV